MSICVHPIEFIDAEVYIPESVYACPLTGQVYTPQTVSNSNVDVL